MPAVDVVHVKGMRTGVVCPKPAKPKAEGGGRQGQGRAVY